MNQTSLICYILHIRMSIRDYFKLPIAVFTQSSIYLTWFAITPCISDSTILTGSTKWIPVKPGIRQIGYWLLGVEYWIFDYLSINIQNSNEITSLAWHLTVIDQQIVLSYTHKTGLFDFLLNSCRFAHPKRLWQPYCMWYLPTHKTQQKIVQGQECGYRICADCFNLHCIYLFEYPFSWRRSAYAETTRFYCLCSKTAIPVRFHRRHTTW